MSDEMYVEPIVYPELPRHPVEVTIQSITQKAGNPDSKFARPDGTIAPRFVFVMKTTDPELEDAKVWASVGQSWGKRATLPLIVKAALGKLPEKWELATFNIANPGGSEFGRGGPLQEPGRQRQRLPARHRVAQPARVGRNQQGPDRVREGRREAARRGAGDCHPRGSGG